MNKKRARMNRKQEKGVALILTLILMAVASVMAVSMMFLSSSETMNTANFRLMSQTRDVAEAGINKTANILMGFPQSNGFAYVAPTAASATDPIVNYDTTVSPVIDLVTGLPVVLATNNIDSDMPACGGPAIACASYPDVGGVVQTNFNTEDAGALGTLPSGTLPVTYASYAELLSMEGFVPAFSTTPTTIQTWRITSRGHVDNVQDSTVEVSAILDRPKGPAFPYALFAEGAVCGALDFNGTGADTGSYDSSNAAQVAALLGGAAPDAYGGNVGTNGNMEQGGGSIINGSLSTPNSGVGNCVNGSPNALDQNGGATVTGGLVQLPQLIDYDDPAAPVPTPTPTAGNSANLNTSAACNGLNAAGPPVVTRCTPVVVNNTYTLTPTCGPPATVQCPAGSNVYGNLTVVGGDTIILTAGTYNMNCISLTGGSTVVIAGPVILNMGGVGCGANTVVSFGGGNISNASLDPSNFQILYAGTAQINLAGGVQSSALVYAPNSLVTITGGTEFYGAIVAEEVTIAGGTDINYDRRLQRMMFIAGPYVLQSFTWKKF